MRRQALAWFALLVLAQTAFIPGPQDLSADWVEVAPGISYREFRLSGPNRAFVARMDRNNPSVTLEISRATFNGEDFRETVSSMASRHEGALLAWGPTWGARGDVVVAINGAFHNRETGIPDGIEVQSGWYTRWDTRTFGGAGFLWTLDRMASINLCAHYPSDRQRLVFLDSGVSLPINGVDARLPDEGVVLYTPDSWNGSPGGEGNVEVVVKMPRPAMIIPAPRMTAGLIEQVRRGQSRVSIPFDHLVITGRGTAAQVLLENARPGGHIGISLEVVDLGHGCNQPRSIDWSHAYAGVAGGTVFLQDGEIYIPQGIEGIEEHPRTAITYNDEYIFFVVVDGRQPGWSLGMTIEQLALFCRDRLGATWGVNQDGGGSSTMWLNGVVRNRPSDGYERRVPNGLMMVVVEPMARSDAFWPRQGFELPIDTPLRLGPGFNYAVRVTIPGGESDTILDGASGLNGLYATGTYWWYVDVEGLKGWIPQEMLVPDEAGGTQAGAVLPAFP
ncbi:MAG: phosphodiester glycosidase family protein [Chloroflexota bacterium]